MQIPEIYINKYNYELPDDYIAKFPLSKRDESKLLIYKNNRITEKQFKDLPEELPENSLLFFNNTKVIQARLHFYKDSGAKIEVFCLEPVTPTSYELIFQQTEKCTWLCLIGNLKKWKNGNLSKEIVIKNDKITLHAEQKGKRNSDFSVEFSWNNPNYSFAEILEHAGELPIPPYLNRKTEASDLETYQTVYSKIKGSVAAPTAGLHFTPEVFDRLKAKNIHCEELTLHVGTGTFRPVKTEKIDAHEMHTELFSINKESIEKIMKHRGEIVAVGTTCVRTLESLYYLGLQVFGNPNVSENELIVEQWQPYNFNLPRISLQESLHALIDYLNKKALDKLTVPTQIMIVPGFDFKIVSGMITNFHQPKSTLLLLVSAFLKENWKAVYDYALSHELRFLSYGDSSLLWREGY